MLFRKKIDRYCTYCQFAGKIDGESMVCQFCGVVPSDHHCRRKENQEDNQLFHSFIYTCV